MSGQIVLLMTIAMLFVRPATGFAGGNCADLFKSHQASQVLLDSGGVASHMVNAEAFVKQGSTKLGSAKLSFDEVFLVSRVKGAILSKSPKSETEIKVNRLVEKLAREDEAALQALFMLEIFQSTESLRMRVPEARAGLDRLVPLLEREGFLPANQQGLGAKLRSNVIGLALASPAARPLLSRMTHSEDQVQRRKMVSSLRKELLSVEKAKQAILSLQKIKAYLLAVYEEFGVHVFYPEENMTSVTLYQNLAPNGGILMMFGENEAPKSIITAYGETRYNASVMGSVPLAKYVKDLGLVRVSHTPGSQMSEGNTIYAVTKLPDGTVVPMAQETDLVISDEEVLALVLQVPEQIRGGFKIQKPFGF